MIATDDRRIVDPGDPLPPLPGHTSRGRLERVLRAGRFAVTSELNPPDSADPRDVYDRAVVLSEVCDAINAVDASGAHVHMSSVGICALLTRAGYAVVMQIACRDKNRIAIQGDVLGAAAMGVANILCLTGDGVQCGDQPEAKPVFDLDSITTSAAPRWVSPMKSRTATADQIVRVRSIGSPRLCAECAASVAARRGFDEALKAMSWISSRWNSKYLESAIRGRCAPPSFADRGKRVTAVLPERLQGRRPLLPGEGSAIGGRSEPVLGHEVDQVVVPRKRCRGLTRARTAHVDRALRGHPTACPHRVLDDMASGGAAPPPNAR